MSPKPANNYLSATSKNTAVTHLGVALSWALNAPTQGIGHTTPAFDAHKATTCPQSNMTVEFQRSLKRSKCQRQHVERYSGSPTNAQGHRTHPMRPHWMLSSASNAHSHRSLLTWLLMSHSVGRGNSVRTASDAHQSDGLTHSFTCVRN